MCPILGNEPVEDVDIAKQEYSELLEIAKKYKKAGVRENSLQKYITNKPGDSFKGNWT